MRSSGAGENPKFARIRAVCESSDDPFNLFTHPKLASDNFVELSDVTLQDICQFLVKDTENAKHTHKFFKFNPGAELFATNWRKDIGLLPDYIDYFLRQPAVVKNVILAGLRTAKLHESKHLPKSFKTKLMNALGIEEVNVEVAVKPAQQKPVKEKEVKTKPPKQKATGVSQAQKFTRLSRVCEQADPFNLMKFPKQASDNFVEIGDVTGLDAIKFLMQKENAIHAAKFFKKNPGADIFATNWRREFGKAFEKDPNLMREMILNGGKQICDAILSEGFLDSQHLDPATQKEMKVLMNLMGADLPGVDAKSSLRQGLEQPIATYLKGALAKGENEQVQSFITNLMNVYELRALVSKIFTAIGANDEKVVLGMMDALVMLKDSAVDKFIMQFLAAQPKEDTINLLNQLASFKDPVIDKFIIDNVGNMPHYVEMSRHSSINSELKNLMTTINLRASVQMRSIETPTFFHPNADNKAPGEPPPTPRGSNKR
jgi:hypothetical protein